MRFSPFGLTVSVYRSVFNENSSRVITTIVVEVASRNPLADEPLSLTEVWHEGRKKTKETPFLSFVVVEGRGGEWRPLTGYAQNVSYLRFERIERLKALTYASRSVIVGPRAFLARECTLTQIVLATYLSFFLFFFSSSFSQPRRISAWVFAPRVLETCAHNTFPRILPIVQYLCTSSILGLRTWLWVSEASLIAYNFTRSEDYYY